MAEIATPEIIIPEGYCLDEQGRLVNESTGEITEDANCVVLPNGSSYQTPEEKERRRRKKEERLQKEAKCKLYNLNRERFCFVDRKMDFADIPPAMVTKLIYLSTFARFKDNTLMLTERTPMEKKDFSDVLHISVASTYNFWNAINPEYLTQSEADNTLILDKDKFKRGRLRRKEYIPYQKLYDKGVRCLYEAADGKYHKQLGYLFKLLPYISIEFNMLCHNPDEKDIDKVELMSIADFCDCIGYQKKHIDKLKKIYNSVRFDVNGVQERFCTMIYNGIDEQSALVCINPAILYAGSNQNRVEITRLYFKD